MLYSYYYEDIIKLILYGGTMKKYLLLSLTLFGSISYAMPGKKGYDQKFFDAIRSRDEAAIKLHLDNGADANSVQAASGNSPLHWALNTLNKATVVRLLLDHGADVNAQDKLGLTALHTAVNVDSAGVLVDSEAIARLLLERGSDPLTQDELKRNPLDHVKSDAIRKLIKNEISKRRATMIWTLKGVHHTGPQTDQELERKNGLPPLPSLPAEIIEKIMLKADPSLEKTLIKRVIEREKESVPFEQMEFSDIIQRFDTSLLTIADALSTLD